MREQQGARPASARGASCELAHARRSVRCEAQVRRAASRRQVCQMTQRVERLVGRRRRGRPCAQAVRQRASAAHNDGAALRRRAGRGVCRGMSQTADGTSCASARRAAEAAGRAGAYSARVCARDAQALACRDAHVRVRRPGARDSSDCDLQLAAANTGARATRWHAGRGRRACPRPRPVARPPARVRARVAGWFRVWAPGWAPPPSDIGRLWILSF